MTAGAGRTQRDEIIDMIIFRRLVGKARRLPPKMIPLSAKDAPLAAVLRAWHEAGDAEDKLEARWHRAIIRLVPPEHRAVPWEDPEWTVYQAFKDPKVLRLRGFWNAAVGHETAMRQKVVDTRAVTLAGIVAKLTKAAVNDALTNSALRDLKRVARRVA